MRQTCFISSTDLKLEYFLNFKKNSWNITFLLLNFISLKHFFTIKFPNLKLALVLEHFNPSSLLSNFILGICKILFTFMFIVELVRVAFHVDASPKPLPSHQYEFF
jgi:hypothetical protein